MRGMTEHFRNRVVECEKAEQERGNKELGSWTTERYAAGLGLEVWGFRILLGLGLALGLGLSFSGIVLDAYTRRPVPYAAIASTGRIATYTDTLGRFELAGVFDTTALEVSRIGYVTRLVHPAAGEMTIYLTPELINLEGITVSAFRTPTPQSRSGPVVVLSRQLLEPQGRTSIADAIALTPSLFAKDYANLSTVSLRGANSEQTLVLFDGVPLNSAQDNLADLTTLPLSLADRIEVMRGTNSALYGANSIGGLINIIPPEPDSFSARATGGIGSLGRRHTQFQHTNRLNRFGYALAGSLSRTGPRFSYRDTGNKANERINSDLAQAGLLARVAYCRDVSLLAEYHESRRGVPGPVSRPSESARLDDSRTILHLTHTLRLSDNARLEAKAFHHRFWRHYWNPDTFAWTNDTHTTVASGIALKQTTHLLPWATAVAGLEAGYDRLTSTAIGNPDRLTGSGWLEARLGIPSFEVTPMARLDLSNSSHLRDTIASSTFQAALSPKLVLAGSPLSWLDLYASVGRSFRRPTFNEMYWPEDQWTRGNPELRPEWATSIDFSATSRFGSWLNYRLGAWHSYLTDLIQWQPDSNFVYAPVNLDTATITGVEAESGTEFRHGGVSVTMTYMRARSAGKDLLYRPRLTLGVRHWLAWDPVRLSWEVRHTGSRYTNADNTDSLPGFLLLDLGCSFSPRAGPLRTALRLGVRNLLDRQYQVMKDYPVPGRTLYGELELEM